MSRKAPFPPPDLGLASVRENGVLFETGKPVTFRYAHNNEKSPYFGATYGQDIEPSGFYCLHVDRGMTPTRGWSYGMATLERPLVLVESLDPDSVYGSTGWKARLFAATKKRKQALSRFLLSHGFDSIVPVRAATARLPASTTEILILRADGKTFAPP